MMPIAGPPPLMSDGQYPHPIRFNGVHDTVWEAPQQIAANFPGDELEGLWIGADLFHGILDVEQKR